MPAIMTNESAYTRKKVRKERSCVACRAKAPTVKMFRFILTPNGDLLLDWRRNLGGRGAHVCPTKECLERSVTELRFNKFFKATVHYPTVEEMLSSARSATARHLASLFSACNGARVLAVGSDAVRKSLSKKKAACILVAEDASMRRNFEERASLDQVPVRTLDDKQFMGNLLGRRPTGVIAVEDRGFAKTLLSVMDRLRAL